MRAIDDNVTVNPGAAVRVTSVVTEPGVYPDMPESVYHLDPVPEGSLSHSGSKRLLPPSCPALYQYGLANPAESTDVFDIGKAAHRLVLGAGAEIVEVEADSWRTNAAKDARQTAWNAGEIPLLTEDYRRVHEMADALRQHPVAAALIEDSQPELSVFFRDEETGIMRRARMDIVPTEGIRSRLIIADYKSAASAHPVKFAKAGVDYGYHSQAAWYLDAAAAVGLGDPQTNAFIFIAQDKTPPYLVSICEYEPAGIALGRERNRAAIDLYAACVATNNWPDYGLTVHQLELPAWAYR